MPNANRNRKSREESKVITSDYNFFGKKKVAVGIAAHTALVLLQAAFEDAVSTNNFKYADKIFRELDDYFDPTKSWQTFVPPNSFYKLRQK